MLKNMQKSRVGPSYLHFLERAKMLFIPMHTIVYSQGFINRNGILNLSKLHGASYSKSPTIG